MKPVQTLLLLVAEFKFVIDKTLQKCSNSPFVTIPFRCSVIARVAVGFRHALSPVVDQEDWGLLAMSIVTRP